MQDSPAPIFKYFCSFFNIFAALPPRDYENGSIRSSTKKIEEHDKAFFKEEDSASEDEENKVTFIDSKISNWIIYAIVSPKMLDVVYFYQQTGALHAVCWSKKKFQRLNKSL